MPSGAVTTSGFGSPRPRDSIARPQPAPCLYGLRRVAALISRERLPSGDEEVVDLVDRRAGPLDDAHVENLLQRLG